MYVNTWLELCICSKFNIFHKSLEMRGSSFLLMHGYAAPNFLPQTNTPHMAEVN